MHEIKHDGFRVIARRDGERVRLYSRPGNDLTYRFSLIAEVVYTLAATSCLVDGEAVALRRLRLHWRGGSRRYLRVAQCPEVF